MVPINNNSNNNRRPALCRLHSTAQFRLVPNTCLQRMRTTARFRPTTPSMGTQRPPLTFSSQPTWNTVPPMNNFNMFGGGGPASQPSPEPFGPGYRFGDLESLALPTAQDISTSTHTAEYTSRSPSPSRPCFWIQDNSLIKVTVEKFRQTLARDCRTHGHPIAYCETPMECRGTWRKICDHIMAGGYQDEGFVVRLGSRIIDLISDLFNYIDGSTCTERSPATQHSQRGDTNVVRSLRERLLRDCLLWAVTTAAGEWKTDKVFNHHRGDLTQWKVLPRGRAENMEAIMVKLGLQINTAANQMLLHTRAQEQSTGSAPPLAPIPKRRLFHMRPNGFCIHWRGRHVSRIVAGNV
ncbi:hypothetical protein R3P38DRAFT_414409 [Favolaschia claudopus]|uniref:Uncharacterized protein n=1 Tax=Favolaschia claudopus TaxID=2862362 RepID=A0AAV9ZIU2_9AGAR